MTCPSSIATYTKHMGGVDLGDQLRKYYSVRLKCYKYIFWFMFDVCITNAYVLTKYVPSCERQALIGTYNSRKRARRCSNSIAVTRPTAIPDGFHAPRHHPRQRCYYCREYRNPPCRRESVWQCLQCEGYPTLCLTGREDGSDCWSLWHREE